MSKRSKKSAVVKLFRLLPEPARSRAISNIDKKYAYYTPNPPSLSQALVSAFQWANAPEGHSYWEQIRRKAAEEEEGSETYREEYPHED